MTCQNVEAASTRAAVTVGVNARIMSGKEIGIINASWNVREVKKRKCQFNRTYLERKGVRERVLFEVFMRTLVSGVFDSKVLNAICVSLNSCSLALFSSNFCVVEALRFSG